MKDKNKKLKQFQGYIDLYEKLLKKTDWFSTSRGLYYELHWKSIIDLLILINQEKYKEAFQYAMYGEQSEIIEKLFDCAKCNARECNGTLCSSCTKDSYIETYLDEDNWLRRKDTVLNIKSEDSAKESQPFKLLYEFKVDGETFVLLKQNEFTQLIVQVDSGNYLALPIKKLAYVHEKLVNLYETHTLYTVGKGD